MSDAIFVTSAKRPASAKIQNQVAAPSVSKVQATSEKEIKTLERYSGMKISTDADLEQARIKILKSRKPHTVSVKKKATSSIAQLKDSQIYTSLSDPHKRYQLTKDYNEVVSDGISPRIAKKIAEDTGLDDIALEQLAKTHGTDTTNIIKKAAQGDVVGSGVDISKQIADKYELGLKAKDACPDTSFSCPWFDMSGLKMDLDLAKYGHAVGDMLHKAMSMMDGSMFGNLIRCASYIAAKGIGHVNKLAKVVGTSGSPEMLSHVAKSVKLYYGDDHSVIAKVPDMPKYVRVASGNGNIKTPEQKEATRKLYDDIGLDGYALVQPTYMGGEEIQPVAVGSTATVFDSDTLNEIVYGDRGTTKSVKSIVDPTNTLTPRTPPPLPILVHTTELMNAAPLPDIALTPTPEPEEVLEITEEGVIDPDVATDDGGVDTSLTYGPLPDPGVVPGDGSTDPDLLAGDGIVAMPLNYDPLTGEPLGDTLDSSIPLIDPNVPVHNISVSEIGMASATLAMTDRGKLDAVMPSHIKVNMAPGKTSIYRTIARQYNTPMANTKTATKQHTTFNAQGDEVITEQTVVQEDYNPVNREVLFREQFNRHNGILKGDTDLDASIQHVATGNKEETYLDRLATASLVKRRKVSRITTIPGTFDKMYDSMYLV